MAIIIRFHRVHTGNGIRYIGSDHGIRCTDGSTVATTSTSKSRNTSTTSIAYRSPRSNRGSWRVRKVGHRFLKRRRHTTDSLKKVHRTRRSSRIRSRRIQGAIMFVINIAIVMRRRRTNTGASTRVSRFPRHRSFKNEPPANLEIVPTNGTEFFPNPSRETINDSVRSIGRNQPQSR